MSAATAAQRAQMEKDVAGVRAAFARARPVVEGAATANTVAGWLGSALYPWLSNPGGLLADDAAQAVKKQFRDQSATLETWATTWRQAAEEGQYELGHWRRVGEDLASFAAFVGKQARYTLSLSVVASTASATVQQTAAAVRNPLALPLPGWVWWVAGGVAVVALLSVVRPVVAPVLAAVKA